MICPTCNQHPYSDTDDMCPVCGISIGLRYVSDNPNLIQPPRWTRKGQAEAWVIKRYGWTKTKARTSSRKFLTFVWYHPGINW